MPVRNPSFRLSPTANDEPHGAAICRCHTGCGLIIRRLKKKWPKKGPGKGPTLQSDHLGYRFAARHLLQRNDFRVGRRGLEPRTYGLIEDSGERLASQKGCKQRVLLHQETPRTTQIDKERAKKGPHTVPSKQADVLHGTDALTPSAPPQGLAPARSRTTRSSWDRCGGSDEPARFASAQCCASGRQGVASPRPR